MGSKASGSFEEFPNSEATAIEMGDWYIIIANGDYIETFLKTNLMSLSYDCDAVCCLVEEHVMYSMAEGWHDNKRVWSVLHNSEMEQTHLEEKGELPSLYAAIRSRLVCEQETGEHKGEADYIFDIPIELAGAITGFRHDRMIKGKEHPFETLIPGPIKPPLLDRFFIWIWRLVFKKK